MKDRFYLYITAFIFLMMFIMVMYQIEDYFSLIGKIKSFTAADGQSLCLRIQTLEKDRLIVKPCEYTHDSR